MLFDVQERHDAVAVVNLIGALRHADSLEPLETLIDAVIRQDKAALVFDCRKIDAVRHAGVSAFVTALIREREIPVVASGIPEALSDRLERAGVDHALPLFRSLRDAINSPLIRSRQLRNRRAVVLCPDFPDGFGPLGALVPPPMLDVLGLPAVARTLDHLETFGIRDVVLAPGRLGDTVTHYLRDNPRPRQSLFYVNASIGQADRQGLGPLTLLRRLALENAVFEEDVLVMDGHSLTDVNIADMFHQHAITGADVTVAARSQVALGRHNFEIKTDWTGRVRQHLDLSGENRNCTGLSPSGAFIFSRSAAEVLPAQDGGSIGVDFLRLALREGLIVQSYTPRHATAGMTTASEYMAVLRGGLTGKIALARPNGAESGEAQYLASGANVSPRARIDGPCYVSSGAVIAPNAVLSGPVIVGAGARIETGAVVQDSLVLQNTQIERGALVDGQIVHGSWSFSYAQKLPKRDPEGLDGVATINSTTLEPDAMRETG